MATRQQFVDAMVDVFLNHGVYIGTANGEYTEMLTVKRIHDMEVAYGYDEATTNKNIRRDLAYIGKCYEQGFDMSKSRAGDCSGIVYAILHDLGVLKHDMRAKDFQDKSTPVALKDLQLGDLVFDKTSNATHMGVYDGFGYVIESRGRDYGVTKRLLKNTNFVIGGRLDWFDNDVPVLTRNLRYISDNLMRGQDVKQCQERLNLKGYDAGVEDGIFGLRTYDAVIEFQTENNLEVDGVVGKLTWAKLFEQ